MTIKAHVSAVRLDAYLGGAVGSRSAAERLIDAGAVTVNGRAQRGSYKVKLGDVICVAELERVPTDVLAEDISLAIVYEDRDIIVVDKPKGMVVHPAPGHYSGTLVNALLWHCGSELSDPARFGASEDSPDDESPARLEPHYRPGIVHRIDKDTSGLLVAAKNDDAHRALSAQLAERSLSRTYEAVIVGAFRESSGTIDQPIGRNPRDRKKMAVVRSGGRRAVTHWELIERYRGYSHVRCRLETGRTHQIRVHLASQGHPVLGDAAYGSAKNAFALEGQCLHARELRLTHPRTLERMTFEALLPEYFTRVLSELSKNA